MLEQVKQQLLGRVVLVPSFNPVGSVLVRGQVSEVGFDNVTRRNVVRVRLLDIPFSITQVFFLEDALQSFQVIG